MDDAAQGRLHTELLELWKTANGNKDDVAVLSTRLSVLEERGRGARELMDTRFADLEERFDDVSHRLSAMQKWGVSFLVTIIVLLVSVLVALIGG
jgi:hypothetical protein